MSQSKKKVGLFELPEGKAWYLLFCKGKEEERACLHLANQDIPTFYPTAQITKIRKGRRQIVTEPLFPNYVFVELDHALHNFTSVRSTRGVIDFVKQGKEYQRVPSILMDSFQALNGQQADSANIPKTGDSVTIKTGAYENIQAIYAEPKGEYRAILLIKLLNKEVSIELANDEFDIG